MIFAVPSSLRQYGMHQEVGHFLAAYTKKVKLGIPYFIPNITLGSFGAITQFKSILPDRRTKVDISAAGPLAGAALSFSMFCVGLLLSSNPDAAVDLVEVPSMLFQGSLLLGLISRATLGYTYAANSLGAFGKNALVGFGLTTYSLLGLGVLRCNVMFYVAPVALPYFTTGKLRNRANNGMKFDPGWIQPILDSGAAVSEP
ncbi:putative zinc metalloprotease egy1, chloroplastic [Asimina triloba]